MRQSAIAFYTKKLELEGIVSFPSDDLAASSSAVVVCHSHPMLGGNMNDPVVASVCQAADKEGLLTLRFNFRGVGESQGQFTNGDEEHNDIKAALDVMSHWPRVDKKKVGIVGYSVGATIILNGLKHMKAASAMVLVAPTLAALRTKRFSGDNRPRLVVAGSEDRVAPSLEIQRILDDCSGPVQFQEIQGADHSMSGYQQQVGEVAASFLAENLVS